MCLRSLMPPQWRCWPNCGKRAASVQPAALARAQGAIAFGPVERTGNLQKILRDAVAKTRAGNVVVVEVLANAKYDITIANSMVRGSQ